MDRGERACLWAKQNAHQMTCPAHPDPWRILAAHDRLAIVKTLRKSQICIKSSCMSVHAENLSADDITALPISPRWFRRFIGGLAQFDVFIVCDTHGPSLDTLSYVSGNESTEDTATKELLPEYGLTTEDLELHHEIYEPYPRYVQQLYDGEDPSTVGIGTYRLCEGRLVRTLHNGRVVRVPTSFEEARQLVYRIHINLGHVGVEATMTAVSEQLFVQFKTQLVELVVHSCDICNFTRRKYLALHPLYSSSLIRALYRH